MSVKKEYSISEEAYRNKLKYIAEYNKKMSRITIQVPPDKKAEIKRMADNLGMSVKEYIMTAIHYYNLFRYYGK
jgi:predicted DNA binding CopG/RHH family protein